MKPRLLLIDNYDSFTYNLVQAFMVLGAEVRVFRNDEITVDQALALAPTHLCISSGSGSPDAAGVSLAMIAAFAGRAPVLGVSLGHHCLAQHFGGQIRAASSLMHGKASRVSHDGKGLFAGLDNPFEAGRYHSLIVNEAGLSEVLEVSARAENGEIMGLRHRSLPLAGVQFHPDSVLTPAGDRLMENFIRMGMP